MQGEGGILVQTQTVPRVRRSGTDWDDLEFRSGLPKEYPLPIALLITL